MHRVAAYRVAGRRLALRMHLGGLDEVERWVLSWGTHAMVMQPQVLAERVGSAARELAERYGKAKG